MRQGKDGWRLRNSRYLSAHASSDSHRQASGGIEGGGGHTALRCRPPRLPAHVHAPRGDALPALPFGHRVLRRGANNAAAGCAGGAACPWLWRVWRPVARQHGCARRRGVHGVRAHTSGVWTQREGRRDVLPGAVD
eukprot:245744-Chlamydomonas_euryale.AAC.1